MSNTCIQNTAMLNLLWVIPVFLGIYLYAAQRRRHALARFVEARLWDRVNISLNPARRRWKAALMLLTLTCIILGLTRPGWDPKPTTIERRGRSVVFLLDVSKSMLADDLAPSRLERAKLAILDCIESFKDDQVGLVAFAGTAAVKCPLTLDYGFFRMMLEDISPESIGRGGTLIGDAIRKTLETLFDDQIKQHKDIILITDGEDHDSYPLEAAQIAGQRGVRILAIGLGDEKEGRRVPTKDESGGRSFLKYQGREVWSKLDADTLRQMAKATPGGTYLNVATGAIDLGAVYQQLVASAEKQHLASATINRYRETFQMFLALALVCLVIEFLLPERRQAG